MHSSIYKLIMIYPNIYPKMTTTHGTRKAARAALLRRHERKSPKFSSPAAGKFENFVIT